MKKVRSGHLIYIPDTDEYCVVIMDDRSRLAITVLTEDMAIKSSWGRGLTDAAKLKAKRIGKQWIVCTGFHQQPQRPQRNLPGGDICGIA